MVTLIGLSACDHLHAGQTPQKLNQRFQTLAAKTYRKLGQDCADREVMPAPDNIQSVEAVGCTLVRFQQASPTQAPRLAPVLLSAELTGVVREKLESENVKQSAKASSQLQFALGRYAFERHLWQKADQWLSPLSGRYTLSADQRQYLQLVRGLGLQHKGRHRAAMEHYRQAPPESDYYPEARTNLAIAHIRQDWWSDAHRIIRELLEHPIEEPFRNRLRVLLGLSRLQQGFYRDARTTFGKITKESHYTPHGWRGIGLSALHLGDFPSALNAFVQLKKADRENLPEGPYLVAFTYDQMGNLTMAEASYTEAILHYQQRLNELNQTIERIDGGNWLPDTSASGKSASAGRFPDKSQLQRQYRGLLDLSRALPERERRLRSTLESMIVEYREVLADHFREDLNQKKKRLQSYLSQSQYGLATIYDRQ